MVSNLFKQSHPLIHTSMIQEMSCLRNYSIFHLSLWKKEDGKEEGELQINRSGSRAAATSKMERFVIIVNGWKPLTIITKRSILDVAAALDPPLNKYKNISRMKELFRCNKNIFHIFSRAFCWRNVKKLLTWPFSLLPIQNVFIKLHTNFLSFDNASLLNLN